MPLESGHPCPGGVVGDDRGDQDATKEKPETNEQWSIKGEYAAAKMYED